MKNVIMIAALACSALGAAAEEARPHDEIELSASAERELPNDTLVASVYAEADGPKQADVAAKVNAAIAWALWYFLDGRWYEGTDDAYVGGNVVQLTPQIPGTVVTIGADDGDLVKQGDVLVKLDKSNADVALAEAKANLAATVRKVRGDDIDAACGQLAGKVQDRTRRKEKMVGTRPVAFVNKGNGE